MRIPRSTIVMAVLTCIPFGLAIRDYVSGSDKPPEVSEDEDSDGEDNEDYEKYERARLKEEARAEARRVERAAKLEGELDALLGKTPASLGVAFGAIKPGMTDAALAKLDERTSALRSIARDSNLHIAFDEMDGILQYVELTPRDEASDADQICAVLGERLEETWSESESSGEATVWRDAANGLRAEFKTGDACTLTFRRYVDPAKWIAKTDGLIPTWAIGQPIAKLVKSLEPARVDLSNTEYEIAWTAPGLGIGTGDTKLSALIKNGKVAALVAMTSSSNETYQALEAQIDALYGAGDDDPDRCLHRPPGFSCLRLWTKKPRLQLSASDDSLHLLVGSTPEE